MANYMLTTTDNPFDPRTHWDEWYRWDTFNGYDTCGLLARLSIKTNEVGPDEANHEDDDAIDRIIDLNPTGNYIKIPIKK